MLGGAIGGKSDPVQQALRVGENCPAVIFRAVLSADGGMACRYLSPAAWKILGIEPDRLAGGPLPLGDFVHEDQRQHFEDTTRHAAKTLGPWSLDFSIVDGNGQLRWLCGNAAPQTTEDGETVWDGILLDISERVLARQKEHESEEKFRRMIEMSNQGILVHRFDEILYANQALADMLGFNAPEEFLALNTLEGNLPEEERENIRAIAIARLRGEAVPGQYEMRMLRKDGQEVWLDNHSIALDWGGERALMSVFSDITARRRAEDDLKASEERFKDFAETASDWFWESGTDDAFVYSSEKAQGSLPGGAREESGSTGPTGYHQSTNWLTRHAAYIARRPFHNVLHQWPDAAGETHYFRVSGKPSFDAEGAFLGYRGTGSDVTESERARRELDDRNARLTKLIENAAVGIVEVDVDGNYRRVNSKFCEITGYSHDELLQKSYRDITHPDDREVDTGRVQALLSAQSDSFVEEKRYVHKDGESVWVRLNVAAVRDDDGRPLYVITIVQDISDRKNAELALGDGEARFRDLAEVGSDWFWETDAESRFTYVSKEMDELSNGIGKTRWELRSADDVTDDIGWAAHLADIDARRPFNDFRYARRDSSGDLRHISINGKPIFDGEGAFLGYRGTGRDITDQVRRDTQLGRSEARFRNLVEGSIQGVIANQPVFVNSALAEILGYDGPDDILSMKSSDDFLHPDEIERSAAYREARLSGADAPDFYEVRALRQDGSTTWLEVRVTVVSWDGQPAVQATYVDIAERKLAEEQLQQSEKRYRDIAESVGDWLWETGVDGQLTYLSERYAEVMGRPVADELGHTLSTLEGLQENKGNWATLVAHMSAREPFRNVMCQMRDGGGKVRHNRVSGAPMFDFDGTFMGYRGTATDSTAEVEARVAAMDAQALLQDAVESLSEGFILFDSNERITLVNKQFRELYEELSEYYVPGTSFEEISWRVAESGLVEAARGREADWVRERLWQHRNPTAPFERQLGADRWLRIDERRTSTGGIVSIATDVSELKKAEQKLRALNESLESRVAQRTQALKEQLVARELAQMSLRRSEARLRVLMESTVDAIVVINQEGLIESFNASATEIFGYEAEEAIGKNVRMLMPQPEQGRHDGYIRRYLDEGTPRVLGVGREVLGMRKGGAIFPMEIGVSEVDMDGQRLFAGTMRDISERKRTEEELTLAWRAADAANQSKSEFLSTMSHELRTPLNAILGFTQLLRDYSEPPLSEEQQESIEQIFNGGTHLLALINEVLDLARIEAGRLELVLEDVDPVAVLDQSLVLVKPLAGKRGIECIVDTAADQSWWVKADPGRLKQVLLNLLSNAVKYNRDAGTLMVGMAKGEVGMLRISVSDTGPGIAPDRQQDVFEPFSRLGMEKSKIEGTGVGLSISRQLMESMGGTLDFKSEQGEGSTFWLEIPLVDTA
jgi:PAS domain S-box-containing protein